MKQGASILESTAVQLVLMTLASGVLALRPYLSAKDTNWPSGEIEVIIPSGPGGGFDSYARVLGRAMEETLGIHVIPNNVPGGDGRRGATVAFRAKPDGQTFAIFNLPGIIEPIINGEDVGYDVDTITWLGAMALSQYIVVVAADSPYDTIADLKNSGAIASFTAYGSSGIAANKILCAEVGLECQIITGYPSNSEALIGVVRGDAAASVTPISTAAAFNRNGDLRGILLMTERGVPEFPQTETAANAGHPVLAELGLLRAFGLPPGVPEDIRVEFTAAFVDAVNASSVAAWAADTGTEFAPMTAEELSMRIRAQREILTRYRNVIASGK